MVNVAPKNKYKGMTVRDEAAKLSPFSKEFETEIKSSSASSFLPDCK